MKKYVIFIISFMFAVACATAFAQDTTTYSSEEVVAYPETRIYQAIPVPSTSLYELYQQGGVLFMSLITLCLVGVFLAAWKMPSRVKELGIAALVLGFVSWAVGMYQAMGVLQIVGDISPSVLLGGAKVALIAPIWGCIVFIISLIVRIIQKPKTI